jgi:hypothetical protein
LGAHAVADWNFFPEKSLFTIPEAACSLSLPVPPILDQPGIPLKTFRSTMAKLPSIADNDTHKSIDLFINEHLGNSQTISLSDNDRMRHIFLIGQTGTGKSTLLTHMILQDIRSGKGLCVIDPHGDMVDEVIEKIPENRIKDVILFDMLDREYPIGFNIIDWETEVERDLIIDNLYQSLDDMYDMKLTGGPIFERYFRGMMRLLMMDNHIEGFTPTLLEFPICFINFQFRQWLKNKSTDPGTKDFVTEIEKPVNKDISIENVAPYITSKFGRFISDNTLKNIIGQNKSAINFEETMNNGKIMLIKLGKGRFGPTVSALLTNQLVLRFKIAAMKRGDIPPEKRRDFYLYVDEASNLPQDNFTELLSEARKYRLGLVFSTQYTSQIDNNNKMSSLITAIMGNVGTIGSFRLGYEDSIQFGRIFLPTFSEHDIRNLPNFRGIATTLINNHSVAPFNFLSIPDNTPRNKYIAKAIINHSRLIYGTDAKTVKSIIDNRRKIGRAHV